MKRAILGAVALAASAITIPALAQSGMNLASGHPYVGLGAGASKINSGCVDGFSCDRSDTAIKLYGGWELPNHLAAELTYFDLGKFKTSSDASSFETKGSYWGLGGAWRPEFGNGWGGVARLGAAYTEGKVDYSLSGVGASETRNSWHPYAGLGVSYEVAKGIKLEADWDNTQISTRVQGVGSTNYVNSYTLGASFAF